MPRTPGQSAPSISAPNQDHQRITPDFEQPTVVYFYPRDDTPGCTVEASQFEAEHDAYRDAGIEVFGVSTDDVDSHESFADQEDLSFDLLADPDGDVAAAFGVSTDRGAANRTTFVIGEGQIQRVYEGVDPDGHASAVLADAREDGLVGQN